MKKLILALTAILISVELNASSLDEIEIMEQMEVFTLRDLADSYCIENNDGGYCSAKQVYFMGIRFDKERAAEAKLKPIKISFPYHGKLYSCKVEDERKIKRFQKRISGWKEQTNHFFFFSWDEDGKCLGFL